MAEKFEETAIIIRQEEIADDIYSMWLHTDQIAAHAKAGQFVSVYCNDGSRLLPRPISICEIDKKDGAIRLVYRVAGKGTAEFSGMHTGAQLRIVGPLGNGFPKKEKKAFLIGGGIGIPPMLQLAKELNCEKQIVLGFRDELFLMDEFVPLEEVGKENPQAYCLEEVELGKNYAMVISTSCGLWRYMIGDTVKFTSKNPYKFVITGRTKHFINAFGEELIVDNAEKGLAKACAETGAQVSEYSAAPVFMDENAKCRHQWLIEFAKMPDSVEKFAAILDATLKEVNSDYEAKRWKDIALQPLEVIVARQGLFMTG